MSWLWIGVVLSVFFVSVSGQCTCEASSRDGYTCMKEVADFYTLHWSVGDGSVSMALVAKGAEWVGVSFAEEEDSMNPADAVIGWIIDGEHNVRPYRITEKSVTPENVANSVTISRSAVTQINEDTTVEFTRDLEGGSVEIDVDAEATLINYAIGDMDDLVYHGLGNRGQTTICLAAQPDEEEPVEDADDNEPEIEDDDGGDDDDEPEEEAADTTGCLCMASDDENYTCMKRLSDFYTLHWRYDDDSISMAMVATGAEWVGMAFAEEEGSMDPADAVIGWISDGEPTVRHYRITDKSVTPEDVDNSVTISSSAVTQINEDTTVEFTRDLEGGSVEIDVDAEATLINYAIGDMDDLVYHGLGNRGHTTICIAARPDEGASNEAVASALPPLAFGSEVAEDIVDLVGIENDL